MKKILRSTGLTLNNSKNLPTGLQVIKFHSASSGIDQEKSEKYSVKDSYSLDEFIVHTKPASSCYGRSMETGTPTLLKDPIWEMLDKGIDSRNRGTHHIPFLPWEIQEILHAKMPHELSIGNEKAIRTEDWHRDFLRDLSVQFRSNLDDASVLLESAEAMMQGVSHNSHWWFQLRLMQLRIYGYLDLIKDEAGQCLVFRRTGAREGISKAFHDAWRIAGNDPFRLMRTLRYLQEAQIWFGEKDRIITIESYKDMIQDVLKSHALNDENLLSQIWKNFSDPLSQPTE
jgi:hypothetical protein